MENKKHYIVKTTQARLDGGGIMVTPEFLDIKTQNILELYSDHMPEGVYYSESDCGTETTFYTVERSLFDGEKRPKFTPDFYATPEFAEKLLKALGQALIAVQSKCDGSVVEFDDNAKAILPELQEQSELRCIEDAARLMTQIINYASSVRVGDNVYCGLLGKKLRR